MSRRAYRDAESEGDLADVRGAPLSSMTVDIAIPVFNEERALPGCIETLWTYLSERFPFAWEITIVDNGSTDGTLLAAEGLASAWPHVSVLHQDRKGKGLAVRTAWLASTADVVAYMDVDLSTGLDALLPMVASLVNGHADIAMGSRLAPGARVIRGVKRDITSRGYNALLRLVHGVRFTDAQCGFKAARAEVVVPLLRRVRDNAWFFDTELLLLAELNGLRLHEVAVDWVDDVASQVAIPRVASGNLRGVLRLARLRVLGAATVSGLPQRPAPTATHPDAVLGQARRVTSRRRYAGRAPVHLAGGAALVTYVITRFVVAGPGRRAP